MMLVVGATGQVGGAAVAELVKLRASVRALVRSNDKGRDLAQPDVELCVGDLENIHSLVAALRGVESVLLVSAIDPRHVELQGNLVATARRSGVAHIVKLSGLATAPDSTVRSGRWHAETEAAIANSGMAYTFLRPPFFLQNMLPFATIIAERGVLPSRMDPATMIAMVDGDDHGETGRPHCACHRCGRVRQIEHQRIALRAPNAQTGLRGQVLWHGSDGLDGTVPGRPKGPDSGAEVSLGVTWGASTASEAGRLALHAGDTASRTAADPATPPNRR